MENKRGCFRVNYFKGGQAQTAFVVAADESAAAVFMGVRDGTAQVNRVASPVEVDGLDKAHEVLVGIAPTKAPFEAPAQLSQTEVSQLRTLLPKS